MTMANGFNLSSFVASAERGARQSLLPPGYFAKQSFLQSSEVFNATYGRKVWDALNNQTRFWNIVRKVQFGPTVGWRLRTDRGTGRSGPIAEAEGPLNYSSGDVYNLPPAMQSNFEGVQSDPRTVGTVFGISLKGQIMSGLEGGMGDNLAVEQEAAARDHIKELNQEILLRSYAKLDEALVGTDTTANIYGNGYGVFRRGDTFAVAGSSAATNSNMVTSIDDNGDLVIPANANVTGSDNGVLYATSRNGFTSLDDIVSHDGIRYSHASDRSYAGVYNVRAPRNDSGAGRGANSWYSGRVDSNDGTGRDLTLQMLDRAIRTVRERGGDPDIIVTGYDQLDRLASILQAQQRFMGTDEFVVEMGDDRTLPGTHTGFQVATYKNIPIFPDVDVARALDVDGSELGSNIYVMDSRYLEVAIAAPTQYIDNRDFFQANSMALRGLFYTIGEFRSYRFDTNYKITDLNDF